MIAEGLPVVDLLLAAVGKVQEGSQATLLYHCSIAKPCGTWSSWYCIAVTHQAGVACHTVSHPLSGVCMSVVSTQGMQSVGVPVADGRSLVRLWAHEALRVFHDRLVDDTDRDWFCGLLSDMLPKHLSMQFNEAFSVTAPADIAAAAEATDARRQQQAAASAALRNVLYADFLQPKAAENAKYQEATDVSKLLKALEDALTDYNAQVNSIGGRFASVSDCV